MMFLAYTFHLTNDTGLDADGSTHTFVEGTPKAQLPQWAIEKLAGHPRAFANDTADAGAAVAGPTLGGMTPPPMSGRGSSREAWADYAQDQGVKIGLDDHKEAIVAALRDRGIPVSPGEEPHIASSYMVQTSLP